MDKAFFLLCAVSASALPGWAALGGSTESVAADQVKFQAKRKMAANGHFTLGTDRYPGALNKRGTIEFDTPGGAQIGVLGIRIPAVAAHTYTTLPALAK
jgi:hypothetical protein